MTAYLDKVKAEAVERHKRISKGWHDFINRTGEYAGLPVSEGVTRRAYAKRLGITSARLYVILTKAKEHQ